MGCHFEHHWQPLADRRAFARRVLRYLALSSAIILGSLAAGVLIDPIFHRFLHRFHLEIDER
jgi:hypothetical protein